MLDAHQTYRQTDQIESDVEYTNWLTVREASSLSGVAEGTIHRWARDGRIPSKDVQGVRHVRLYQTDCPKESEVHHTESDFHPEMTAEIKRLMSVIEDLSTELKAQRIKTSEERERTDSIIMQQARTIDSLTAEVRQLRALPVRRSWWERLFLKR